MQSIPTTSLPAGEALDALVDLYLFGRKTLAHPSEVLRQWSLSNEKMPCTRCGKIGGDRCLLAYSSDDTYLALLLRKINERVKEFGGGDFALEGDGSPEGTDDLAFCLRFSLRKHDEFATAVYAPTMSLALCRGAMAMFGPRLVEFEKIDPEWLKK